MDHPGLLELLQRQHGVASNRQLADLGMSGATIWHARRDGDPAAADTTRRAGRRSSRHVRRPGRWPPSSIHRRPSHRDHGGCPLRAEVDASAATSRWRCPSESGCAAPHGSPRASTATSVRTTSWCERTGSPWRRPHRMLLALAAAFNDYRFERAAEDAWCAGRSPPQSCATFLESRASTSRRGAARFGRWVRAAVPQ